VSSRVALKATLVTLAFLIALVYLSAAALSTDRNSELARGLSLGLQIAAPQLEAAGGDLGRVKLLEAFPQDAQAHLTYFAEDGTAIYDNRGEGEPLSREDAAEAAVGVVRGYAGRDRSGTRTLNAIYGFPDGAHVRISSLAVSTRMILHERRLVYTLLTAGGCLAAFVVTFISDARRRSAMRQVISVLEDFAEGRYDARVTHQRGSDREEVDELNGAIERIQERVFRQRSRDHALSVVMNQMQSGIIVVDARLHILLATPVARKLLGIAPNSEGVAVADASKDVNLGSVFAEAMRREGVYTNEVAARTAVGRGHRPLRLYVSPMRQDGKVVGALAMVEDITELRRLEQVRTDFVANVSHELKTPLTSIKGFVETLMDGAISNPQMAEKFLKIIMLEAERLTRLINDILSISKLESGMTEVTLERIQLDKMAFEAADMLRIHAAEKDVTINAHRNKKPTYIIGNPDRVEQMLINLIENGIKYNKPGGSVTVHVFGNDREANLTISDTGIGIAEEHLPRLFERFYRVDKGRSRSMGGTGLGLAIVKHIVRSMNGEIEVHSKIGEGTEFLVTLPVAPDEPEDANPHAEREPDEVLDVEREENDE